MSEQRDIVDRLRCFAVWNKRLSHYEPVPLTTEAADEIERLRQRCGALDALERAGADEIASLRAQVESAVEDLKRWRNLNISLQAQLASAMNAIQHIEDEARRYAGMYPDHSDGRNTFVIFADMVRRVAQTDEEGKPRE